MDATLLPPPGVLRQFRASGEAVPLPGGQGVAVRCGDLVLKRVDDVVEAAWLQDCTSRVDPVGFRVAAPRQAVSGGWVADGWIASAMLDGLRPAAPDWALVIRTGERLIESIGAIDDLDVDALSGRRHRWARADRCAWGEERPSCTGAARDLLNELLRDLGVPVDEPQSVIHGDLAGNVHVAADGTPVVLDLSPYLRPPAWQKAIVWADMMLAGHEGVSVAAIEDEERLGLLRRAVAFRLEAESGEVQADPSILDRYRAVTRTVLGDT